MTGKGQSSDNVQEPRRSEADLGQEEAALEKASEEQLRHMEGNKESSSQARRSEADLGQEEAEREAASKEQLKHMEGGEAVDSAPREKAKSRSE